MMNLDELFSIALEAEGDINIMADDAEEKSFGDDDEDEGGDDNAGNAGGNPNEAAQPDQGADDAPENPDGENAGADDVSAEAEGATDDLEDTSEDPDFDADSGASTEDDITSNPKKVKEAKITMINLYNKFNDLLSTISTLNSKFPKESARLNLINKNACKIKDYLYESIADTSLNKDYPELLRRYYGSKEIYITYINMLTLVIKDIKNEEFAETKKGKRKSGKSKRDRNATKQQ